MHQEVPMADVRVFDSAVASASQWLRELMTKLELEPEEAGRGLHALRAGLHAIRDRLPAAQVIDLGAQLPALVRGQYYEGWRLTNDPTRIRNREELLARVEHELAPDSRFSALAVVKAVIELLEDHVSAGEIVDVSQRCRGRSPSSGGRRANAHAQRFRGEDQLSGCRGSVPVTRRSGASTRSSFSQ
jgi:uncharacterized protein (DUF2267 family)